MSNMNHRLQTSLLQKLTAFYSSDFAQKYHLKGAMDGLAYGGTKHGAKGLLRLSKIAGRRRDNKGTSAKQVNPKHVFDLRLSDEQTMLCENLKKFSQTHMRPQAYQSDKDAAITDDLFRQSQDLGLAFLAIDETYGGASCSYDPMTSALIAEQLAHGDVSIAYALLSSVACINAIGKWGSAAQKEHYFKQSMNQPETQAALAIYEPGTTLHSNINTKASRTRKGFVLSGKKALVPLGSQAQWYLVAARLGSQVRLFVVPNNERVHWQPSPAMGLKAAQTGTLVLNKIVVGKEALLGGRDTPFDYAQFLDLNHLHQCALAVGCSQAILDYVTSYVNEREAFGEPISQRQSVAFMVADMALELEGMRLMYWRAVSRAMQGLDCHRETFLAHQQCLDKGMRIATDGVQLLGGHGFTKEHPVERWYRDMRGMHLLQLHL